MLSFLKISHFRTHKLSFIEPENKAMVIYGVNGAGKTNVLGAISLFAPGRGFRRAKFADLNRRPDLLGWKLTGEFKILEHTYEVITFWDEIGGRRTTIDGKMVSQSRLAQLVRILWITPLMDQIWLNGSAERRRFLDRIVSNLVPQHTENLIKYYKALKQRNRMIKDKVSDSNWFEAIEKEMVLSGVKIDKARQDVLTNIMEMQKRSVSSFPVANLQLTGTRFSSAEEFLSALRDNRRQDIFAGRTLIGPHLTDLCAVYSSKNIIYSIPAFCVFGESLQNLFFP